MEVGHGEPPRWEDSRGDPRGRVAMETLGGRAAMGTLGGRMVMRNTPGGRVAMATPQHGGRP